MLPVRPLNLRARATNWWRGFAVDASWATGRATARTAWRASRPLAVALGMTALLAGVLPIVQMVAVSQVIGAVPEMIGSGGTSAEATGMYLSLGVLAAVYLAAQLAPVVQWSVGRALGARADVLIRVSIMDITLGSPGLERVVAPEVADAATQARESRSATFGVEDAMRALANLVAGRLQGLLAALVLGFFHWWAPLILLASLLPWDAYFRAEHRKMARGWVAQTPHQARAAYFRDLGTSAAAGKEVRVFGLAGFVRERFARHFLAGMAPHWRERRTDIRRFLPRVLLVIVGYAVVFGSLGGEFATGEQGPGTLTLFLLAAGQIWRLLPSFNDLSQLAIGATPILALHRAGGTSSIPTAGPASARAVSAPRREIRFEGVSFTYPGSETPVLRNLDLTIPIGQSLALVGENGAGKTTLVTLLCGLYRPTAGRITVDGADLADEDGFGWRRHVAAVFQDFVQYPLSVRENVSFGAGGDLGEAATRGALRDAGADDLFATPWSDMDTTLGRDQPGGIELSGGQWQKVAVARALAGVRGGARLLILDEPTANMDVRSEAALFTRMLDVTAGLTTILVSHRFANVRRADRIVVLESGRITEDGTHDELLVAGGTYAAMFRSQAARFAEAGGGA
jgi:ATP-binding cassette subfamily B protein